MIRDQNAFRDRRDAGRRLAAVLQKFHGAEPVILALPRGGVPVAFEVAKALSGILDLVMVRKIGVPGHEELALGAVVDGHHPQLVLNEEIVSSVRLPPGYIAAEEQRQLAEIERRRHLYRGNEPPVDLNGRLVILVDDGIATGATVRAALRGVRRSQPSRLILAVPVAPASTLNSLAGECDELICLSTPDPFYAVGLHYIEFGQTSDDEVVRLLDEASQWAPQYPASRSVP